MDKHKTALELKALEANKNVPLSAFCVVDAAHLVPKCDVENYLHSFERICILNAWPEDEWPAILQSQLTGKALALLVVSRVLDDKQQSSPVPPRLSPHPAPLLWSANPCKSWSVPD